MTTRIWFSRCGMLLLLVSAVVGTWAYWEASAPSDAWTVEEPQRTFANFGLQDKLRTSFRLRNTAHMPYRILGASTC